MRHPVLALVGVTLATVLLMECGTLVAVESGWLDSQRPDYGTQRYWQGNHERFGVWRHPNTRTRHQSECFDVDYRSNAIGARDIERSRDTRVPRVVVLGDSFLGGWGVAAGERLSNRLEASTGIEHINLAMAFFGPYQELIVYRELARDYSHDAVLVGLLPANDFVDIDLEQARIELDYQYLYRPYLTGDPPDYTHLDLEEPPLRRGLRDISYLFNALLSLASRQALATNRDPEEAEFPSWYYDYSETQVARLDEILRRLSHAAAGKTLVVLLIPTAQDFTRFDHSGPAPLSRHLAELSKQEGFILVDLLPAMARRTGERARFFFPCDYHWSPLGNRVAAQLVERALATTLYAR